MKRSCRNIIQTRSVIPNGKDGSSSRARGAHQEERSAIWSPRIHVKYSNRCPACGRHTNSVDFPPHEMLVPSLASRMKQLSYFVSLRIDPCQVSALVQITVDASQSKVVEVIGSAVNLWNDVLNVKGGQRRIILMQMTILASVLCALTTWVLICDPIIYDCEFESCWAWRLRMATNLFART